MATTEMAATLSPATTGVNPWWTYEEQALPGIGKAMVNVGTGNLLVQSDDVDVAERGIDLAFRRTYNSQSTHDVSGTDGTPPSVYGNGWTNPFDVHLAYNASANTLSVYDLDGARYDYSGATGLPLTAGMQGTMVYSDGLCGFYWLKKSGTYYYFWEPAGMSNAASCNYPAEAGYAGRVSQIVARNHNNSVTFSYSWAGGNESSDQNITQIVATHSDGQKLTLAFATFGSYNELSSITRPDGALITYSYDTSGNLLEVTRPGNATDDATRTQTITQLSEQYQYYPQSHMLQVVSSPRYVTSGGTDGSYTAVVYSADTPSEAGPSFV